VSEQTTVEKEVESSSCRCGGGKFLVKRDSVLSTGLDLDPRPGTLTMVRVRALCPSCGRLLQAMLSLDGAVLRPFTEIPVLPRGKSIGAEDAWTPPRPAAPWGAWSRDYLRTLVGSSAETHRNVVRALDDDHLLDQWRSGRAAADVAIEELVRPRARAILAAQRSVE